MMTCLISLCPELLHWVMITLRNTDIWRQYTFCCLQSGIKKFWEFWVGSFREWAGYIAWPTEVVIFKQAGFSAQLLYKSHTLRWFFWLGAVRSCWFGWNSVGPISAKPGRILLKFGSFESLGQKLQQDPCASRLRHLGAFLPAAKLRRSSNGTFHLLLLLQ